MHVFFPKQPSSDTSKLIELVVFSLSFFLGGGGRGSRDHSSGWCNLWVLWSTLYICHQRCFASMDFFCVEAGLCFSCLPWQGECVQRRSNSYLSVLCDQRVLVMARLLARGAGSSFSFFLGEGGVLVLSFSYCWAWRALVRTGVVSGDAFWCFGI